jgi:hypothetical protein
MTDPKHEDDPAAPQDRPPRRPYTSPRLTAYGSVATLTRGNWSVDTDGSRGGFQHKERSRAPAQFRVP